MEFVEKSHVSLRHLNQITQQECLQVPGCLLWLKQAIGLVFNQLRYNSVIVSMACLLNNSNPISLQHSKLDIQKE